MKYLKADRTPQLMREVNWRKENINLVQSIVSEVSVHLKREDIMFARTVENVTRGEELFIHHGTSYQFVRAHQPQRRNYSRKVRPKQNRVLSISSEENMCKKSAPQLWKYIGDESRLKQY